MNTTRRIEKVEGDPLATGYKILNWDWTGSGGYCYADENGNVEGSIHTVDGSLDPVPLGTAFLQKIRLIALIFYGPEPWDNRFVKVSAFDEVVDHNKKKRCVVQDASHRQSAVVGYIFCRK
jgi:hypothetical protein